MCLGYTATLKPIWAATWQNQQSDRAPSENSDQPGYPPSLIRLFAVRSVASWGPKLFSGGQRRLDQTGWMPRLIWVFAGRTVILLVLSWSGSFKFYELCPSSVVLGSMFSNHPGALRLERKFRNGRAEIWQEEKNKTIGTTVLQTDLTSATSSDDYCVFCI